MGGATVLMPLPDVGFDVTESAVPWRVLTRAGHAVVFCTERGGRPPAADPLLFDAVVFGQLGAESQACAYYRTMEQDDAFRSPVSWEQVDAGDYDGLVLPGGHAPGTRQYLGSPTVWRLIADFFAAGRPVGAICHGALAASRARDDATGLSVLHDRRTTCLPKYQELGAYLVTRWKLGRYYRTYPAYVEDEVKTALRDPDRQFLRGPIAAFRRDSEDDRGPYGPGFVVEDGTYLSARWPGDAYTFAHRFRELLERSWGAVAVGG
jgi:putative intracellular protease/amidase